VTSARPSPAREPGDVRGPAPASPAAHRRGDRSLAYGAIAAAVGAALLFALAGPLSVDTGLLVVGVAVGWVVGVAVRTGAAHARSPAGGSGTRVATAIALALAAWAVAWAGTWGWSHVQGGVLGPAQFLIQVYGLLIPVQLMFATAAAAIGSR
jgi:hypothetical protein